MENYEDFKKSKHYKKLYKNASELKSLGSVFKNIYDLNLWECNETKSGIASSKDWTINTLENLINTIENYNVNTILDIPCGDVNWIHPVFKHVEKYFGADIVLDLIKENNRKYIDEKNVEFEVINIIDDDLINVDLIYCRDLFMHLSNANVKNALENIKKSGAKYLLTSIDVKAVINEDILDSGYRPINLTLQPFNLPEPILFFDEKPLFVDDFGRGMGLWEINKL